MGELTYDQLKNRLAQGKLGGSYFLKTEDIFLRDEAIDLLTDAHLTGGSADFDLDQINGDDADASELASRLSTPPMLSPYRVIVVREAQGLTPSGRSVIQDAVAGSVPTRALIVSAQVPRGSKAKLYGILKKHCTVVDVSAPRSSDLPGWLVRRAREEHDVELDGRAGELLVAAIGGDLGALAQELEKLVTYAAPAREIGAEQVREAVGALPRVDRWGWIDTVMDRKFQAALDDLTPLLDAGESAVGLLGFLGEALIRVGLAKLGKDRLVQALKRDGAYGHLRWKVRIYARQASGWPASQIDAALEELLRADRLIKSGGLGDRAALEEAILRIAALARNGAREGIGARGD